MDACWYSVHSKLPHLFFQDGCFSDSYLKTKAVSPIRNWMIKSSRSSPTTCEDVILSAGFAQRCFPLSEAALPWQVVPWTTSVLQSHELSKGGTLPSLPIMPHVCWHRANGWRGLYNPLRFIRQACWPW